MAETSDSRTRRPAPLGAMHFATEIGGCAIAWSDAGVVAVQLPESTPERALQRMARNLGLPRGARLLQRVPGENPPYAVRQAIAGVQAMMRGERPDLDRIVLDMRGVPEFACRVYALTRAIAPGETRTYGELARELGDVNLARAVGQSLGANPFAPVIPCHRVLAAGDRSGGFSAHGGAMLKLRMLDIEGACPGGTLPLF